MSPGTAAQHANMQVVDSLKKHNTCLQETSSLKLSKNRFALVVTTQGLKPELE
jgi:hypothetical protein